jgi:hypothetical protein
MLVGRLKTRIHNKVIILLNEKLADGAAPFYFEALSYM